MEKIKYEVDDSPYGTSITKCPIGRTHFNGVCTIDIMVGSGGCENCEHNKGIDEQKQIVKCKAIRSIK